MGYGYARRGVCKLKPRRSSDGSRDLMSLSSSYNDYGIAFTMCFKWQDDKCDLAKSLGATAAFNTKTTNWVDEVLKATDGKGVDIIIDFIGAESFQGNLDAIAQDGVIVTLGMLGGIKLKEGTDISAFVRKRVTYRGSSLRSRDEAYQGKLRDQLVEHALPRFIDGRFKILVDKVLPWEKIQEAHRLLEENKTKGKVICTIG
jgi:NADPH:quinone reductase-like Zn-dependent oxidoreductase